METQVRSQAGSALLLVIVVSAAFAILTSPLLDLAVSRNRAAAIDLRRTQAIYLAESGVAEASARLATGDLHPPGPGQEITFSSGSALGWDGGTYRVTIRNTGGRLRVESTGTAGGTSRTVSATFARTGLIPAQTFLPGPLGDGVIATSPDDPRYLAGYSPPQLAIQLPTLPAPPASWDGRTRIGPGTYVFDRIEVTHRKEGLVVQADTGPVEIYVAGYVVVSEHCTVTCQGQYPIRFYVLGSPPADEDWAVIFENDSQLTCATRCAWTVSGGVLIDNHAYFGAVPGKDPPLVPISLNATGDLSVGADATLGSPPAPGNPPHILAVVGSAQFDSNASAYAMVLAPAGQCATGAKTDIEGALVCATLDTGKKTSLSWNDAIGQLTEPAQTYGWETPAGSWEAEVGTWEVR